MYAIEAYYNCMRMIRINSSQSVNVQNERKMDESGNRQKRVMQVRCGGQSWRKAVLLRVQVQGRIYPNVYPSLVVASGSQNNDEVDVYKTMIIVGSYVTQTASNYCNCTFKGLPSGLKRAKRSKVPTTRHRYDASFVYWFGQRGVYHSVCMV